MNIMNIDTQEIDLQPVQPLQLAVCLKEYSITKVLLKAAANVNNTNSSPPALNIACYNHDLRMMQLPESCKSKKDSRITDRHGEVPGTQ